MTTVLPDIYSEQSQTPRKEGSEERNQIIQMILFCRTIWTIGANFVVVEMLTMYSAASVEHLSHPSLRFKCELI